MTELIILCTIIFICIFLSMVFSGAETALTAVSRAHMMTLEKNGNKRAKTVQRLIERRDKLISVLLIVNNLVNIFASSIATSIFLNYFGDAGIVYATLLMTAVLVVFAEILPKSWAIYDTDRFSMAVAPVISVVFSALGFLSEVVNKIVRKILRVFGVNLVSGQSMLTAHEEIRGAVEMLHREGYVRKADRDQLGGLLDLHELEISDVMIHRTAMTSINVDLPPEVLIREILSSPHTRLPLWRTDTDNIVGIVHVKDVLRALHGAGHCFEKINIMAVASEPWFVPDTTGLQDQLNAFLRRKAHIAIVVDEYGEVQGLVTLEDIIEEIVGEIEDEHDVEIKGLIQKPDGSLIVDGTLPIRDLNRAFDWDLPDSEATTIAGLVIHETQMIPDEKQTFTFYSKRFTVLKRNKNRLERMRIVPLARAGH